MAGMRFAGSWVDNPVGNFLLDGPIARSAMQSADRPLSWLERRGKTPEQLQNIGLSRMFAETGADGKLTEQQRKVLDVLGVDRDKFDSRVGEENARDYLHAVVDNRLDDGRLSPEAVYALGRMVDNTGKYSGLPPEETEGPVSAVVRRVVVPLAGNAAVAGGAVLAVKGAMDVIARMQAGENVSEEEVAAAVDVVSSVGGGMKK